MGLTFSHLSSSSSGKDGSRLEAGADAEDRELCCLLMACSASFLMKPRNTSLEVSPPTIGWGFLCQSLIKKYSIDLLAYNPIL